MRRLARDPLAALTALSVVVAVVASLLWARAERVGRATARERYALAQAYADRLQEAFDRAQAYHGAHPKPGPAELRRMNELQHELNRLVAEQNRLVALLSAPGVSTAVYVWVVAAASLVQAIWLIRRHVRRAREESRRASKHCVTCGYDLRATPERCPECGAAAASA